MERKMQQEKTHPEPLIILHVTDLHCHQGHFEWITQQFETFDILCLSGDLIDHPEESGEIEWVSNWLNCLKKPTFICSGNHDVEQEMMGNEELLSLDSSVDDFDPVDWDTDNSICQIQHLTIGCVPFDEPNLADFYRCDILLHHVPPAKTATSYQKGKDWGCTDLYFVLKHGCIRPHYLLCGHVHHPKANRDMINNTIVLNPGATFENTEPKHHYISV